MRAGERIGRRTDQLEAYFRANSKLTWSSNALPLQKFPRISELAGISVMGHSRRFRHVRGMSGQEAISDMAVLCREIGSHSRLAGMPVVACTAGPARLIGCCVRGGA